MRNAAIPVVCLLAYAAVHPQGLAQMAVDNNPPSPIVIERQGAFLDATSSCAAGLHIQRGSGGGLLDVNQSDLGARQGTRIRMMKIDPLAAQYHLSTANKQVFSMQITAHGFSNQGRVVRLDGGVKPDLAKTIDVSLWTGDDGTPVRDIRLDHFAGVTSIDIEAITYTDGTTWRARDDRPCTVRPDPLMLVNSH